jgi:hypothetical protein
MKTLILSLILIIGLSAINHGKPINDIYSIKDPVAEEELYIDDIPFNTWEIAVESITEGDETVLKEEPYVDDIPFDTRAIANLYLMKKMVETTSENNVNDIPFNTEKVVNDYLTGKLTEQYRDEANVIDIPCQVTATVCRYEQLPPVHVTIKAKSNKRFTIPSSSL